MQCFSGDLREENKDDIKVLEYDLCGKKLCALLSSEKRRIWREKSFARFETSWIKESIKQTRAVRGASTGRQAAAVQRGISAPSEEENILLHDIWFGQTGQQLSINPCNKLLPHISQIRIVVSVYNWRQSQVSRVLIWCVVSPNISFQPKTKSCAGSQWRVWNREVNCLRSYRWLLADLKSCVLP